MDGKINKRIRQVPKDLNAIWHCEQVGDSTFLSPDPNHDNMGCINPTIDIPLTVQEINSSGSVYIPIQDAGSTDKRNYGNKRRSKELSNNSECNIYNMEKNKDNNINKEDDNREQQDNSKIKSENNASSRVVCFENCPNKDGVFDLQSSVGELFRIHSLDGVMWEENPEVPCNFVQPHDQSRRKICDVSMSEVSVGGEYNGTKRDCKDRPIVVEKIKDEFDSMFVALSLGFMIREYSAKHLISQVKQVQEYGFDHIIIIGELPFGILFMDCYGRVFEWNTDLDILYLHGDDIEAAKRKYVRPELWVVEYDGTIDVINSDDEFNTHNTKPIVKKDKKKKKKHR
ncbi:hypothetical protein C1645_813069 [Glomus cerebriforme]|uniref:Uncharacterized protein n=1 Tax=Glomus cerebriforme TaxID=658196 RepID=A0A397TMR5_9GLOM|nr:hypothetical protein C1645_813069 [Glomus cerebriforme]